MVEFLWSNDYVAARLSNYLVVIGGTDRNHEPVPTHVIWMYNCNTDQWKKCQTPNEKSAPPTVLGACAAAIGTAIYRFGGYDIKLEDITNEMWKLTRAPEGCFDWSQLEFQHGVKLPSPRANSSCWEYEECLWVFGGSGPFSSEYLNDHGDSLHYNNNQLLCYEPSTQMWTNPQCFGSIPSCRESHSTDIIGYKVWLFGGLKRTVLLDDFYELDMQSCIWTQITTGKTKPLGRFASSLTAISESHLVLHAGCYFRPSGGPTMYLYNATDTWIMDLPSQAWRRMNTPYHDPHPQRCRHRHTGSRGINSVIISGGCKGDADLPYPQTFHVMIEPKSLQQIAMKTIYNNQDAVPWKSLPSKLVAQLGLLESKEMIAKEDSE